MKSFLAAFLALILTVSCIGLPIFFNATPTGKAMWNNWFFAVQKADDTTNYTTRKEVEDKCRSMIVSYTSDQKTYELYKDSDSEEKQSWAEQARMRANKTAASYNEYVLKNSFVWDGNIPSDILSTLPYL